MKVIYYDSLDATGAVRYQNALSTQVVVEEEVMVMVVVVVTVVIVVEVMMMVVVVVIVVAAVMAFVAVYPLASPTSPSAPELRVLRGV